MKIGKLMLLSLCGVSAFAQAPVIRTIAGNGRSDRLQEGAAALNSSVRSPNALAFDRSGNLFISTFFGPVYKLTADGALYTAIANPPQSAVGCSFWSGIALDREDRIYLADMGCHQVWRADGGAWSLVAGTGRSGFSGDDGPGASAELSKPSGLAFDDLGNLYIADYGNLRIRVVSPDGVIRTYAGNGRDERSRGDGGAALDASIRPVAVAVDPSRNLYVADFPASVPEPYYANHSIRMVGRDGRISTVAASSPEQPEVVLPMSLAAPADGRVYFGDLYRVRVADAQGVRTIAGSLQPGFSGDGGPAVHALLLAPQGLAVDASGNIYVADVVNMRVRRIEAAHIDGARRSSRQ